MFVNLLEFEKLLANSNTSARTSIQTPPSWVQIRAILSRQRLLRGQPVAKYPPSLDRPVVMFDTPRERQIPPQEQALIELVGEGEGVIVEHRLDSGAVGDGRCMVRGGGSSSW